MQLTQIYQIYQIPQNLREHMLRVAAVAKIVVDGWPGDGIDKTAIVETSLLHDIAKPITFDPDRQAKFGMSSREIEELREYQVNMRDKYGESEHEVLVGILGEIDVTEEVKRLALGLEWSDIPKLLEKNDLGILVPIYADMRVGMKGILPIVDRVNELRGRASFVGSESMDVWARQLEDKLQVFTNTKIQDIDDNLTSGVIKQLQNSLI